MPPDLTPPRDGPPAPPAVRPDRRPPPDARWGRALARRVKYKLRLARRVRRLIESVG